MQKYGFSGNIYSSGCKEDLGCLSLKGTNSFRVFVGNRVAYMDIIGSGNDTSAHILENGRITFMFCAYDGPPLILRLYGKGYAVLPDDAEWLGLSAILHR